MLDKATKEQGLELANPRFGMARYGNQLFGVYDIIGHTLFGDRVKMMLGLMNSYDKSLRARVCYGSEVFCCSNLCFSATSGEDGISSNIGHKHTTNVYDTLWYRINKALEQVDVFHKNQEHFCESLADRSISQDEAYGTIIRAGQRGVINKTKMLDVAERYNFQEHYPENEAEYSDWHPEFQNRNTFNLFNAFTEIKKQDRNIVDSNIKSASLYSFFEKEFVMN